MSSLSLCRRIDDNVDDDDNYITVNGYVPLACQLNFSEGILDLIMITLTYSEQHGGFQQCDAVYQLDDNPKVSAQGGSHSQT